jgi:putative FmdB family regulatory protein
MRGNVRVVPRYDFRCRECERTFEVSRPMSAASEPAPCPVGHADTVKLLSAVAVGGLAGASAAPRPAGGSGGCCGGGCCR